MHRPLIPFVAAYIYGIVAAELFRYFPVTVSFVSLLLLATVVYFCIAITGRSRMTPPPPPINTSGASFNPLPPGEGRSRGIQGGMVIIVIA
ncbi:MAG: hypothetical protein HZA12_03270, partial [Nitrospirae bacterium]|nr:hypothetical protein [Nitrospirota bacterium]